jgi:protein TonB
MRSGCICLTVPSRSARTIDAVRKETWRTAICFSLVLHVLLFSVAIRIGNSQAVSEPKPIEVELGIRPENEWQGDVGLKAPTLGNPKASKETSHPKVVPHDAKQAVASATVPAAPAASPTPAVLQQELKAVSLASSTVPAPSRGATNNDSRPEGAQTPMLAAAPGGGVAPPVPSNGGEAHAEAHKVPSIFPYVINGPPPVYPPDARSKGWTGKVKVRVLITEQGTVKDANIAASSGHESLDAAALKAVLRWLFHPAYRDGHPVVAWVAVPVVFKLN